MAKEGAGEEERVGVGGNVGSVGVHAQGGTVPTRRTTVRQE